MKIERFEMERMQSTWENLVELDMSESGVRPVTLRELVEMGFDLETMMDVRLGYSQSNGTPELRDALAQLYPGSAIDNIEVTNGTSEANYLLCLSLLKPGDEVAMQFPNYMQLWGVCRSLGAKVNSFHLRHDKDWELDWDEFERAVNPKTRLVYISNPNNPTGQVLSSEAMKRIVKRCEEAEAYLLSDEVYLGAEIEAERTQSFWGMGDRVVITSGLSKAYGIPGIRIGWIVGPQELVYECWTQHDYLTIGPNKLSDAVARTAVRPENREKLYARTRAILKGNLPIFHEWARGFEGFLTFKTPIAGAIALVRYDAPIPSQVLCERIRERRNTLVVPGSHLGLEGFVRLWLGGTPEFLREGLRRVQEELQPLTKTETVR